MDETVYLSIAFDPRELWFQAGFDFRKTQVAQWSYDMESPLRALERFFNDDLGWKPPNYVSAKDLLSAKKKVVVSLDQKSAALLEALAELNQTSAANLVGQVLGDCDVEIQVIL